jgi:hypothetical protein
MDHGECHPSMKGWKLHMVTDDLGVIAGVYNQWIECTFKNRFQTGMKQ